VGTFCRNPTWLCPPPPAVWDPLLSLSAEFCLPSCLSRVKHPTPTLFTPPVFFSSPPLSLRAVPSCGPLSFIRYPSFLRVALLVCFGPSSYTTLRRLFFWLCDRCRFFGPFRLGILAFYRPPPSFQTRYRISCSSFGAATPSAPPLGPPKLSWS